MPARSVRATRGGPASDSRACSNPRAAGAALWGFRESGAAAKAAVRRRSIPEARQRFAPMDDERAKPALPRRHMVLLWRDRRGDTSFRGHAGATAPSSKWWDFDEQLKLAVPGHGAIIPAGGRKRGGARARKVGSKMSMTTMRPPQQGHGGFGTGGSAPSGAGASTAIGTARSSRARAVLALRPAVASRP